MASDVGSVSGNGTFTSNGSTFPRFSDASSQSQQGQSVPAPDSFGSQSANVPSSNNLASTDSSKHLDIPKDQVGWHFVEQYYLNLSRSPTKLHVSLEPSYPQLG